MTLRSPLLVLAACAAACAPPLRLSPDDSDVVLARHTIDAPDPTARGPHAVRTLFYGSGTDRRRAEFRDSVTMRTATVDASRFVDLGSSARSRNRYWGFTPKEMPINGRVWYPEGEGPFPLVLIVHGNHDMKDFSDPGYGWLGELLASRGTIMASVDMNFINGGIRNENDARGWFLLKHLDAFRQFNDSAGNPLHGRVDLNRVVLIGHSRGGEAVGHAAAFNRMLHYPDDANTRFQFGYGIRGVVAIAPVDGQYRPADRLVPVRDVSYLVFHGSHDGDVSSFMGQRQYQRVTFSGETDSFKSAVYVYRANHGQWNTVWGAHDNGPRSARILDLRPLLPPQEQRRFGMVYISAFVEAVLRDDRRYLPLFRDHRVAGNWLPRTMYVTRYADARSRTFASFEEDVDVTTTLHPGIRIRGDSLATWREGAMHLRSAAAGAQESTLQNHAVWLGWNRRIQGERDSTRLASPAALTFTLDESARRAFALDAGATLEFSLLPTDAIPAARRRAPGDSVATDTAAARTSAPRRRDDAPKPQIDLSVEVVDVNGVRAQVPVSTYGAVRHPLDIGIWRRRDRERTQFGRLYETVLQTYIVPFADLQAQAPRLDLARIAEIRFLFDRVPAGTVILDDVGFGRR